MGQPLRIVQQTQVSDEAVRFEVDRSLTGTAHESYFEAPLESVRTADALAERLFQTGDVTRIHIFSNVIDVTFGTTSNEDHLEQARRAIEGLFTYYRPGVEPTPI